MSTTDTPGGACNPCCSCLLGVSHGRGSCRLGVPLPGAEGATNPSGGGISRGGTGPRSAYGAIWRRQSGILLGPEEALSSLNAP